MDGVTRGCTIEQAAATNKLEDFLSMDEGDRKCTITTEVGSITWISDFLAAFEAKMGEGVYVVDTAVFEKHGFRLSTKLLSVCKLCKGKGVARCCEDWAHNKRTTKHVLHGMRLIPYL